MKKISFAVWIFVLWIFQTAFLGFIKIGGIGPQLLYVFIICIAMKEKKTSYYLTAGILCGLLSDVITGGIQGYYLIMYTCTVLLVVALGEVIYKESFLAIIPMVIVFSFILNSGYFFVNRGHLQEIEYLTALKKIIIPTIVYNTFTALLINPFLNKSIYPKKVLRKRG